MNLKNEDFEISEWNQDGHREFLECIISYVIDKKIFTKAMIDIKFLKYRNISEENIERMKQEKVKMAIESLKNYIKNFNNKREIL